jgi:hypothetical protein
MKAIRVLEFGGPLVFDDVPGPAIARGGGTSLGICQAFMGCRPGRRVRQDAVHMARSCFACRRDLQAMSGLTHP